MCRHEARVDGIVCNFKLLVQPTRSPKVPEPLPLGSDITAKSNAVLFLSTTARYVPCDTELAVIGIQINFNCYADAEM